MAKKESKFEIIDKKCSSAEDRKANLDTIKKVISKDYGDILTVMGDNEDLEIPTITSGSIGLDVALGRGGFALGRLYEIYGNSMSGKTTLCLNVIKEAQKRGLTCLFVDIERTADPKLFKAMGININELLLLRGYEAEEIINSMERLIKSGVDVVVIDSVSGFISKDEIDKSVEQSSTMGDLARLMSRCVKRLVPLAGKTNTLLLFINQLRSSINAGNITTGGKALSFYSTGRVFVQGSGKYHSFRICEDGKAEGPVIGHTMQIEVTKNKLSIPFKEANVPLIYGVGFDTHYEVVNIAESIGILERKGSWYKYKDDSIGQGAWNVKEMLKEEANQDLYKEIYNEIIEVTGLKELYDEQNIRFGLQCTEGDVSE